MRRRLLLAAGLLTLTACGKSDAPADNAIPDNTAAALEAQADNLDAAAANYRDDTDRKEAAAEAAAIEPVESNFAGTARVANSN